MNFIAAYYFQRFHILRERDDIYTAFLFYPERKCLNLKHKSKKLQRITGFYIQKRQVPLSISRQTNPMVALCHDDCPEDFKHLFDKSCGRYARNNTLVVARVATEQGRMSARFCGPNLWNQLPETLTSSHNQEIFKRDIKMEKFSHKNIKFPEKASVITFKQQGIIHH